MLLCIDIGNTNIKFGVFDGERLVCRWRVATDRTRLADEYAVLLINLFSTENIRPEQITGCAISSVVPALGQEFSLLSRRYLKQEPMLIGRGILTGMEIHTDYPEEVGPDLIANAVAARKLFGTPIIVVGFGSATTFVAVSKKGYLEGVAIAPGIITAADSLFHATATLPQVVLQRPPHAVGKNTITSLQSGLVFGFAGLVDGMVKRMRAEIGETARAVATGGLAPVISAESDQIELVEPDLTLIGIRLIYELNRPG